MTSQWDMGHDLDKFTASFETFHVKTSVLVSRWNLNPSIFVVLNASRIKIY
jgi:hypothetical protein